MVKLGDYAGRLIIIRADGRIESLPGGEVLGVNDGKYFVSVELVDGPPTVTILNRSLNTVFHFPAKAFIGEWRAGANSIYFSTVENDNVASVPRWFQVEVERQSVRELETPPPGIEHLPKLTRLFDPFKFKNCGQ